MYVNLGEDYFDKIKKQSNVRYSVRRLKNLGYNLANTDQMLPNPTNNWVYVQDAPSLKINEQRLF